MSTQAIILLAHGSSDAQWRGAVERVAGRARVLAPQCPLRCAYLELCEPSLPDCVAELAALGVQGITVLPMFLGVGRHVREDLPTLLDGLQRAHPHIAFELRAPVGEDERLIELLAQMAVSDV